MTCWVHQISALVLNSFNKNQRHLCVNFCNYITPSMWLHTCTLFMTCAWALKTVWANLVLRSARGQSRRTFQTLAIVTAVPAVMASACCWPIWAQCVMCIVAQSEGGCAVTFIPRNANHHRRGGSWRLVRALEVLVGLGQRRLTDWRTSSMKIEQLNIHTQPICPANGGCILAENTWSYTSQTRSDETCIGWGVDTSKSFHRCGKWVTIAKTKMENASIQAAMFSILQHCLFSVR